jgi:hypothetical protein
MELPYLDVAVRIDADILTLLVYSHHGDDRE